MRKSANVFSYIVFTVFISYIMFKEQMCVKNGKINAIKNI